MRDQSGADESPGYNPQTHADPVIWAVIRKIENQILTITGEDGTRIWVRGEDIKPLLASWNFTASRKGKVWATLKKNARPKGCNPAGQATEPNLYERNRSHVNYDRTQDEPGKGHP